MIKIPSYLTGFSSRADGSAGIRFTTQELSADEFVLLKKHLNEFGYLVFSPNQVQQEDIPQEDAEESKTPSKRLRSVIYLLWEQGGKKGEFESFYREKMEKVIDIFKNRLE